MPRRAARHTRQSGDPQDPLYFSFPLRKFPFQLIYLFPPNKKKKLLIIPWITHRRYNTKEYPKFSKIAPKFLPFHNITLWWRAVKLQRHKSPGPRGKLGPYLRFSIPQTFQPKAKKVKISEKLLNMG